MVREDFALARENGEISNSLRVDFILYFLNRLPGMIVDPELSSKYPSPSLMIRELLEFFYYGIIPRNKQKE